MRLAPLALLPRSVLAIARDVARHLLRRPVVGVAALPRVADGRWLLVRRADTGGWALPGGTVEWGETIRGALERELREEAGASLRRVVRLVGVYAAPERDPRFHAVTVAVEVEVNEPAAPPENPLEIVEARLFPDAELPTPLSMGQDDMLADARRGGAPTLE